MISLYRNVTGPEFDSIASTGKFAPGYGEMEGKRFAARGAHADKWGEALNNGQGLTVTTDIPKRLADQLHYDSSKLDGVGPGYYVYGHQLPLLNQMMNGIRLWP